MTNEKSSSFWFHYCGWFKAIGLFLIPRTDLERILSLNRDLPEAATSRCFSKYFLKRDSFTRVFLWILPNFLRTACLTQHLLCQFWPVRKALLPITFFNTLVAFICLHCWILSALSLLLWLLFTTSSGNQCSFDDGQNQPPDVFY